MRGASRGERLVVTQEGCNTAAGDSMENLSLHLARPAHVALIYPMAAMFFLSLAVLVISFLTRIKAVRARRVRASYFLTFSTPQTDEAVLKTGRHFSNLFEAPVLFYTVCLAAMITGMNSDLLTFLAWLYVGARLVHGYIHIGPNSLYPRMIAYAVSWLFLIAMWIQLLIHISF